MSKKLNEDTKVFSILGYSRREIFQKFWPYVFCAFGTLCIILPMLLWKNFYIDWFRNTWLIEYYGEYIKAHGSFPQVINSYGTGKYQNYVGMMHPSYYGVWLYRILGILCALFGGGARRALFFSIFLLEIIQWVIWYKLLFVISGSKTNSAFVSTIYQLSIYGLTNLYCRNAVPEFYGSIFLSLSLGLWLLSLTEHNIKKRLFYWSGIGLVLILLLGTHPISVLLGGILLLAVFLCTVSSLLNGWKWSSLYAGSAILFLVIGSALPWLYSVLRFKVNIVDSSRLTYFPGIDELKIRLFPLPRCTAAFETILTWHLDAQVNISLVAIWVVLLIFIFKNAAVVKKDKLKCIILFGIWIYVLLISTNSKMSSGLPSIFNIIQFAYRLVTYCDIIALLGISLCFLYIKKYTIKIKFIGIFIWTFVVVAVMGYLLKAVNISEIGDQYDYDSKTYLSLSDAFYNPDDYMDLSEWNYISSEEVKDSVLLSIPVNNEEKFGDTKAVDVTMMSSGWVGVNIYPHAENYLVINEKTLGHNEMYITEDKEWSYFWLPTGNYRISYLYIQSSIKQVIDYIAYLSFILLLIIIITLFIFYIKEKRIISKYEK